MLTLVLDAPGSAAPTKLPNDLLPFVSLAVGEAVIGLAIGFTTSLVFAAVQSAAHLISLQTGFNAAEVLNPMNDGSNTVLETFYSMFATVVFLGINGHHWIIAGMQHTFDVLPVGSALTPDLMSDRVLALTGEMWIVALQIALPVVGAALLTDVALGLLARTVPQMNVFMVGMPLKILVGLLLLLISLQPMTNYLDQTYRNMTAEAQAAVR
jgi:flagellar biosynthetic protein FliR